MIKKAIAILKGIDDHSRCVMTCGVLYSIILLITALVLAIANGIGGVDIDALRTNMLLAESAAAMFPFSIGAGLLLDYCLKKKV